MKDVTVLITACGSNFMPGIIKCFRNNGERNIRIIGCDVIEAPYMTNFVDRYYRVPKCDEKEYVDDLIKICIEEKVDVLFPNMSQELDIIRLRSTEFASVGVKIATTHKNTLSIANNKYRMYEAFRAADIPMPDFYKVSDKATLEEALKELGYPENDVCVKLAESSGSRGVRIISAKKTKTDVFLNEKPNSLYVSLEDMVSILDGMENVPDMIAMRALPGCEYTVDLLADDGKVVYIAGRCNTVSSASIAQESIVEERQDAFVVCQKIVELLELDGNIGFDFILDEDDRPVLTDINPRITATVVLFLATGLNLPYMRVKQLLGEELPDICINKGFKLIRKYDDVIVDSVGKRVEL